MRKGTNKNKVKTTIFKVINMIPKNINHQAILDAIQYIDENGIPQNRLSRTYKLVYDGRRYPPKYLISVANKMVNGKELEPFEFGGGAETNDFLRRLGFEIIPVETDFFKTSISETSTIEIVTVVVDNQIGNCPDNNERFNFMQDVISENISADIILFPAGYFYFYHQSKSKIEKFCNEIEKFLKSINCNSTICFGIDCDDGIDQLAVAINSNGIQAMGRKFHPTADEDGYIRKAKTYNELEMGFPRIFKVKDKKVFLAICYDGFGIRHCNLPDLGIDVVLVLAHQFWKRGEGPSGDVDFARKGFAGASQHWNCPVFGTAVFFCREIPENWPTGVLWTDKSKSVRFFKYEENKLTWNGRKELIGKYEEAICYKYILNL